MPQVECNCGASVSVELWDAGTDKSCPKCGQAVRVPSLDALKRLSGDKHPFLSSWQKLARASELREEPFDGRCHGCKGTDADVEVPIELSVLSVRHVDDAPPVLITPVSVQLNVPGGTEEWSSVVFPLQLCHDCHGRFVRSFRWRTLLQWSLITILSITALAAFWVALPCGIFGLAAVFAVAIALGRRWKGDLRFTPWLSRIPVVQDVLAHEDEYRISRGPAAPIPAQPTVAAEE
jgi:hypothetical protein